MLADPIHLERQRGVVSALPMQDHLPRIDCGDLAFDPVHCLQRLVPTVLQLAGDQTIVGIDGIILAAGMSCRKAGLLTSLRASCTRWFGSFSIRSRPIRT